MAPRASFLGKASSVVSRTQPAVGCREPLSEHEKEKRAKRAEERKKNASRACVEGFAFFASHGCTCTALFWRLSVFPHCLLSEFPHFRIFVFSPDSAAILLPACLPACSPTEGRSQWRFFHLTSRIVSTTFFLLSLLCLHSSSSTAIFFSPL